MPNDEFWCRHKRPLIDCREATPKFVIRHFLNNYLSNPAHLKPHGIGFVGVNVD